jgi:hypothetical protein
VVSSGISTPFGELFRAPGQITHVFLTRAPLYSPLRAFSLDLHVLGTPPAFVLSQDQTLQLRDFDPCPFSDPTGKDPAQPGTRHGVFRNLFANSQECGTAFRRRLAIQFSKTEQRPRLEPTSSSRALTVAESRRQPLCIRGEVIYFQLPASSTGSRKKVSCDPSRPQTPFSNPGPWSSSRGDSEASSFRSPSRVGAASTPTRLARQASLPGMSVRLERLPVGGRCFYPLGPGSVKR